MIEILIYLNFFFKILKFLVKFVCTSPACLNDIDVLSFASLVIVKSSLNFENIGIYELDEWYINSIFNRINRERLFKAKGKLIVLTNKFDNIQRVRNF